jgi:F-type H+-transporting ATPase subunit epsilon
VNDKGLTILAENAVPVSEIKADEVSKKLVDAREDVRLAKTDVERAVAEKQVARYEAMQAVAAN